METIQATTWDVDDDVVHRTGWLVDQILGAPRTRALVARYFDDENGFAAATFDLLGDTDPATLEPADLLAVSLVDVPLSADAVRHLLDRATNDSLRRALRSVPVDADLWAAKPAALDAATQAWEQLQDADGIGPVRASKILARKRPRLIPALDLAAMALLEIPDGQVWATLRLVLEDRGRRDRIEALRPEGLDPAVPVLRLLDVAVWSAAAGNRRARCGALAGDL
jgi:hypothetical protein